MSARAPDAEMPEILKPQALGRPGAREDRDFVERVFAGERFQQARLRLRVRADLRQRLVAEALVHEQPDEMRIEEERRAVRMVGGEEDAPGILEQEEGLEPDHPLHRVDEALVAIAHRHHAAAGVALDVHDHRLLRMRALGDGILAHRVAGCRAGLAEQHLAHVDRDVRRLVDELDEARRAGGEMPIPFGAVAQELRMRHVQAQAFRGAHRGERRSRYCRECRDCSHGCAAGA